MSTSTPSALRRLLGGMLVTVIALLGATAPATASPRSTPTLDEGQWATRLLELVNEDRRDRGLSQLQRSAQMDEVAFRWSVQQAAEGRMYANPDYRQQIPAGLTAAGEALAWGQATPDAMYDALRNASGSSENITNPQYTHIGIGVAFNDKGQAYATLDFARYVDPAQEGRVWSDRILELLNADRINKGLAPLERSPDMDVVAHSWAVQQASERRMYHNPDHRQQIPAGHSRAGENVAWGQPTPERMYDRWYNSPGHYRNMFDPDFTHIGIGVTFTPDGYAYSTQNFAAYIRDEPAPEPTPKPGPSSNIPADDGSSTRGIDDGGVGGSGTRYFLNDQFSPYANRVFDYGNAAGRIYVGDWDGDGRDTLAYRIGSTFYVSNSNTTGPADRIFSFGRPGDRVYVGDWDGDGRDSFAVRRGKTYHVKNAMTGGDADQVIRYGRVGDDVLVGDWDGDGRDTFTVRRGSVYHVKNAIAGGDADRVVNYGRTGDDVYVGDWNADGRDSFTVRRGKTYYIAYRIRGGDADRTLTYGRATDTTLVGDWNGDGRDTLGVRR